MEGGSSHNIFSTLVGRTPVICRCWTLNGNQRSKKCRSDLSLKEIIIWSVEEVREGTGRKGAMPCG